MRRSTAEFLLVKMAESLEDVSMEDVSMADMVEDAKPSKAWLKGLGLGATAGTGSALGLYLLAKKNPKALEKIIKMSGPANKKMINNKKQILTRGWPTMAGAGAGTGALIGGLVGKKKKKNG